ncbi:DNA-binding transcriptional regulator, MerR family [Nocardiopsis flavescens]|uniref:DNA-binding transcriptional regulator, MerR family n=2 Tax=Nocardiopsis flavescens TaxID=758803 RepID=A0A1M6AM09_9ACTN|nr:MerR family transcriptional regulator [Nocardiopsis flavescens]SHI37502.1 DNA-binding transcriptional regulator, MerR family [Nocardiopsis flavescens]
MTGGGEGLRPVDLARAVGVSAQTVRDCEASGVLPPARRTASGQRRFTGRHLAALVAYRALAPGMGVAAAGEVLRTLHTDGVDAALELVEAAFARAHRERAAVREAAGALAAVARAAAAPGPPRVLAGVGAPGREGPLRIGAVARLVGVRASALRVWERAGLVRPGRDAATGYRVYGPEQVRDVRVVCELRRGGYGLERIAPVMEELRASGGGGGDALQGVLRRREEELAGRSRALAAGVARLQDYVDAAGGARG